MSFTADYAEILAKIEQTEPEKYGKTRNFINGKVSRLSPYISRGVISTKQVFESVVKLDFKFYQVEKFVQELAWRDYWQQIWVAKGAAIDSDLKRPQEKVENLEMPEAVILAQTGIKAIDQSIQELYETGYMHNQVRIYTAAIACNMGHSHWKIPAKWMYYHLLDADWASNALSWQWVAGSNANKKYVANQQNINKYCFTDQQGTFLDVEYTAFEQMETPEILKKTILPNLETTLPKAQEIELDKNLPTYVYNWYNLDPNWGKEAKSNRVLLIEPSVFEKFPISENGMDFMLQLSENIPSIQVFVGAFKDLISKFELKEIYFKEHPLNQHYSGIEHPRDWMFGVKGYFPSFFAYWKKCKKELKYLKDAHQ